jgi:prepilin signal peptidase PulO-like enzyme (type II secretory pathway)
VFVVFPYIFLFAFGTAIGSFLNVATLRYDPEGRLFSFRDLRGRSHCPRCGKVLRFFELVPLFSYIAQAGKCRTCKAPLSLQYPLVEIAGGCIAAGIPLALNAFWSVSSTAFFLADAPLFLYALVGLWVLVAYLWLVVAIVDLRHFIIPNGLNLAIGVVGAAISLLTIQSAAHLPPFRDSFLAHYQLLFTFVSSPYLIRLLGPAVGGGFFALIAIISRGRAMGWGDVKLALASGFALGWPDVGLAMVLSFIVGGAWGGVLLALKKNHFGDHVPFGPFFVLGSLGTLCFGYAFASWYFGIFPH